MELIIFLVGVRGAGKTTLLNLLSKTRDVYIPKPITTRAPRSSQDKEYNFIDGSDWDGLDKAWEITVGNFKYGMAKKDIECTLNDQVAVTVFDPSSIDVLKDYREKTDRTILTIGLDTVETLEVQSQRVGGDKSRLLDDDEFNKQRNEVLNCDLLVTGKPEVLRDCVLETIECLRSRGGVVPEKTLKKFMKAGALVSPATDKVSTASYDLRLGDDVWCQGKFIRLSEENPTLKIPAYSYAIVSALEKANLPCFMSARFDLKNSLFFRGIVLSNGPQIDPGYRGALFCMLYNGSDEPRGLNRGDHFSTIEFLTTSGVGIGYKDKYQHKIKLSDFMPSDAAVSEGGKILERTEDKIEKVESEWKSFRQALGGVVLVLIGLILGPSLVVFYNAYTKLNELREDYVEKSQELKEANKKLKSIEAFICRNERAPGYADIRLFLQCSNK